MSPEQVVRSFCEAVTRRDVKELSGFFSADAVYHNIPIDPVTGPEAIEKVLAQFLGPASRAEFELRALAVSGRSVLTERVDRFTIGDKQVELAVMGVFEVARDGKITAWRDYFDMAQFSRQLA
jgi:limonene-1,2-epoxide hydrolase